MSNRANDKKDPFSQWMMTWQTGFQYCILAVEVEGAFLFNQKCSYPPLCVYIVGQYRYLSALSARSPNSWVGADDGNIWEFFSPLHIFRFWTVQNKFTPLLLYSVSTKAKRTTFEFTETPLSHRLLPVHLYLWTCICHADFYMPGFVFFVELTGRAEASKCIPFVLFITRWFHFLVHGPMRRMAKTRYKETKRDINKSDREMQTEGLMESVKSSERGVIVNG